MIIDKYLYFRAQVDEDDDDGIDDSLYAPVRNFVGMTPTSATALTLYFEPVYNDYNGAEATALVNDTVVLTVSARKMKQAMQEIAAAMTSNKLYQDGTIVIADDVVTNLANDTVTSKYIDDSITACVSIGVTAALS